MQKSVDEGESNPSDFALLQDRVLKLQPLEEYAKHFGIDYKLPAQ